MSDNLTPLGRRINLYAAAYALTPAGLVKSANIPPAAAHHLLHTNPLPTGFNYALARLNSAFGCDVNWLANGPDSYDHLPRDIQLYLEETEEHLTRPHTAFLTALPQKKTTVAAARSLPLDLPPAPTTTTPPPTKGFTPPTQPARPTPRTLRSNKSFIPLSEVNFERIYKLAAKQDKTIQWLSRRCGWERNTLAGYASKAATNNEGVNRSLAYKHLRIIADNLHTRTSSLLLNSNSNKTISAKTEDDKIHMSSISREKVEAALRTHDGSWRDTCTKNGLLPTAMADLKSNLSKGKARYWSAAPLRVLAKVTKNPIDSFAVNGRLHFVTPEQLAEFRSRQGVRRSARSTKPRVKAAAEVPADGPPQTTTMSYNFDSEKLDALVEEMLFEEVEPAEKPPEPVAAPATISKPSDDKIPEPKPALLRLEPSGFATKDVVRFIEDLRDPSAGNCIAFQSNRSTRIGAEVLEHSKRCTVCFAQIVATPEAPCWAATSGKLLAHTECAHRLPVAALALGSDRWQVVARTIDLPKLSTDKNDAAQVH